MTKYIFVTGGVVSGLGKGITAASLGRLLKSRGLKVAAQKLDPVYQCEIRHDKPLSAMGRCSSRKTALKPDLDLGHYERLLTKTSTNFPT